MLQDGSNAVYIGQTNHPSKHGKKKHRSSKGATTASGGGGDAVAGAVGPVGADGIEELEFQFDEEIAAPAKINTFSANMYGLLLFITMIIIALNFVKDSQRLSFIEGFE